MAGIVDTPAFAGPPVMDIEASGLGAGSYPIEIGIVLANGDAYCTLIAPEPDWTHWDEEAHAVHGIARSTLHQFGKAACVVAAELDRRLAGTTIYSDAWGHDYTWLSLLYSAAGWSPPFKLASLHSIVAQMHASCSRQCARCWARRRCGLTGHRCCCRSSEAWCTCGRCMEGAD